MDIEPPLKRTETDVQALASTNPSSPHMQEGTVTPPPSSHSEVGQSSSDGKGTDDGRTGSGVGKQKGDSQALKTSAILKQVWKEDLNSGQLLVQLFELFGEGILSFIPAPEMSLFL